MKKVKPVKPNLSIEANEAYYNRLYGKRSTLGHLMRLLVSFDQQSKSKPNKIIISKYLPTSGSSSLLDYGSGWGAFLLKLPKSMQLYCYDLSESVMDMTCSNLGKLGYKINQAIVEGKHISITNLDFITCSHVLEHVEDDIELLKTFWNSLSHSGMLLVNVPINEVWDDPKHLRRYDKELLLSRLESTGFRIVECHLVDKWTGFLLSQEFASGRVSALRKCLIRMFRGGLAVLPWKLVAYIEDLILYNWQYQQLIVVATKRE